MKKSILTLLLISSTLIYAQTITYKNLGALLSEESINGTARFNAMSGAFGALGGDLSAIDVNPAGAAVYDYSQVGASLNLKVKSINARFGGRALEVGNDVVAFNQAGGVFVFDENRYSVTNNNKYAFAFNYTRLRDFDNFWVARSPVDGTPLEQNPVTDIFDQLLTYDLDGKQIEMIEEGKNDKYSFTFASRLENKFHVGGSLNIYDMEHFQSVVVNEGNSDGSGNTFDTSLLQESFNRGNGVSVAIGMIANPTENIRFGVSYQSPVWYNLADDKRTYDIQIRENDIIEDEYISNIEPFDYKLRTPGRLTGSLAYVFGDKGLISADYTYKNYSNIELSGNSDFIEANNVFKNDFNNYSAIKVGGEWRFDQFSARAGFHIEESPNNDGYAINSTEGFSLGLGYRFRGGRVDLAYQYQNFSRRLHDNYSNYDDVLDGLATDESIDFTNFSYPNFNQIESTALSISNSSITTTLVINL